MSEVTKIDHIRYLVVTTEANREASDGNTAGFSVYHSCEATFGDECRDHVGGWFTAVTDSLGGSVWVHDEGLLIGLEQNLFASAGTGQYLVGTAVFTGPTGPDGETTSVDPELIAGVEEWCGAKLPRLYSVLASS